MGTGPLGSSVDDRCTLDDLLVVVDAELATVFAFIVRRCGDRTLAEDLTADVMLRAVRETTRTGTVVTGPWLTTVARNRLVDHWRSAEREGRRLRLAFSDARSDEWSDDDAPVEAEAVNAAMRALPPSYQAVLSLRYLDDLSVAGVADVLGRSVHATESLLVRARRAFRDHYTEQNDA